ncbi:hypothetical protein AB0C42_22305 [Micromonospora taraxaci]
MIADDAAPLALEPPHDDPRILAETAAYLREFDRLDADGTTKQPAWTSR